MTTFSSFFIILLVAVIFSQLFTRMKIPWVVALIIGGIAIGPSGFGIFETDPTIDFLATIGLILLMFMAGVESQTSEGVNGNKKRLIITTLLIGFLPALTGILITFSFGYYWPSALLIGVIFMSSAIAILIPQLQNYKIIKSDLGKTIISATVAVDALSLILLSILLQYISGTFSIWNLLLYIPIIIFAILAIKFTPKFRSLFFTEDYPERQDLFEKELRFVLLILIGFVVFFELIGLHVIIAAFFAGLILSRLMVSRILKAKLHAMSYGFLVPVFFVVVGATTDISIFIKRFDIVILTTTIVLGLVFSKIIGGYLAGKLTGFNNQESIFLGFAVTPQLSTSLAVAFLGFGEGLLDQDLLATIIVLTIATATITPIAISILGRNLTSQQITIEEKEF